MNSIIICGSGYLLYCCLKENLKNNKIIKVYFNRTNIKIDKKVENLLNKKKIVYSTKSINKNVERFLDGRKDIDNIILISLQYRNIINRKIINLFKKNIYNIHFSYLPKNRGCFPVAHAFLDGSGYSGVTLHQINEGIDNGDIVKQEKINLKNIKSAKHLYEKKIKIGINLFKYFINNRNKFTLKKQNEFYSSYYSKTSINFSDSFVNWNQKYHEILNYLKAMNFPPYQYPKTKCLSSNFEIRDYKIGKFKKFNFPGYSKKKGEFFYINCIDASIKVKFENKINTFKKNKNNLVFYI